MTGRHRLGWRRWPYLWLPLVAWMGLIFYLSAQPDLPHPDVGWVAQLFSSSAHAFVFGVLALLWARVLAGRARATFFAFALTMLYALSDEIHQSFVPGRHTDLWDLICDGLGAAMALCLWAWMQRWRKSQA